MNWASWKLLLIEALKWALCLALVGFLVMQMGGDRMSGTSFETMRTAVTGELDLSQMQQADNQMIRRLYGLDPGDFAGCLLYYPTTNMGAEELLLVQLNGLEQQAAVQAAVEARLAAQKTSFDGYGVEQMELLEHCVVEIRGNYILFVVSPDASAVRQAFAGAL